MFMQSCVHPHIQHTHTDKFTPYRANRAATAPATSATEPAATRPAPAVTTVDDVGEEPEPVVEVLGRVTVPMLPWAVEVLLPAG